MWASSGYNFNIIYYGTMCELEAQGKGAEKANENRRVTWVESDGLREGGRQAVVGKAVSEEEPRKPRY